MDNIQINSKDELEIVKEVRQSWSREQLVLDIEILTQQCLDIQTEIKEKEALLKRLDNFNG